MAFALAPLLLATLGWRIWHWSVPEVPAIEVQAAPLQRSLQFSARVARLSRVEVGATLIGRVQLVAVREGAQVAAGALLVQLETDEAQAALAQARATLAQQQARAAGLRSTGRSGIDAQLAQAEAGLRAAQRDLQRSRALVAQGFVSQAQADDSASSSIATPSPTMIRKPQNTGATGGRSLAGTAARGSISPSQLWVRSRLPRRGTATS